MERLTLLLLLFILLVIPGIVSDYDDTMTMK